MCAGIPGPVQNVLEEVNVLPGDNFPAVSGMRPRCRFGIHHGLGQRVPDRILQGRFRRRVDKHCVITEDPARDFIVMRDDWNSAAQRLDVDVAEGLLNLGMQEEIGAPVKIGHLLVTEGRAKEAPGKPLSSKPVHLVAQRTVTCDDQKGIRNAGDCPHSFDDPFAGLERADHQDDLTVDRKAQFGPACRPWKEA